MSAALALALGANFALAWPQGTVVTDTLWSQALGTHKAVVVYLPPSYARSPARRYPVAYYLHGLGGSETDWTQRGHLAQAMDSLVAAGGPEMIVVMPDGDDGWYTTWHTLVTIDACRRTAPPRERAESYCVPWDHYDDYVARDVVQFTDGKYRTRADRAHRAIAGLSMGGYGALTLAFAYADVFAAAASHSGILSPLYAGPAPFDGHPRWAATSADLQRICLGIWKSMVPAFGRDTASWWARDPGRLLGRLIARRGRNATPAMYVDVGTSDPCVDESRAFRWTVGQLSVPLDYHEWPGTHDWAYWAGHVGESLHWIGERVGM